MSSSMLIVLMALTSFLVLPGGASQTEGRSVSDLLLNDEIDQAESLLNKQQKTPESLAYRGEIEFRRGNFDRAEAFYKESLTTDARTSRAHFGMAKLAMTKVKGKDAVQAIKKAIEINPKEPLYRLYASEAFGLEKNYTEQRKAIEEYVRLNPTNDPDRLAEAKAGLEVLKSFGNEEIAKVQAPDSPSPIPFRKSLNLIFTSVRINGQGPYDFAIDTGASQTVLSEKLAGDLGLKPITSTIMHGVGGGGKIDTKLYGLNEISIGDVKVRNLPVGTFNDPLVTQLADGILGTAMLSDFIVTVNYPAGQVELTKARRESTGEKLQARYFSNLLLVPIDVNGHSGHFIVDTGAVTTVISQNLAAKLGVNENTPGAKIDLGIAGVGGFEGVVLRIPNVTFKTPKNTETYPQVVSIDLKQISKMIGTEVSGVIGFDFLEDYKLTLDYYGAEVILTK